MNRTIVWTLWDMQNVAPSAEETAQMSAAIKKAVEKRESPAQFKGMVFYGKRQAKIADRLDGWRPSKCEGDCDEKIVNDARSLAGGRPRDTAIFLVAKDRDYVGLVNDLKGKGAQVYLIAPRGGASRKLAAAVGQENLILLP